MTEPATICVEYVVAKGKTVVDRRTVTIDGGAIVESHDGGPSDGTSADVVFTLTPELAEALTDGTLNVSVGFMRGSIKMAGDNAALFAALPVLHRASGF